MVDVHNSSLNPVDSIDFYAIPREFPKSRKVTLDFKNQETDCTHDFSQGTCSNKKTTRRKLNNHQLKLKGSAQVAED